MIEYGDMFVMHTHEWGETVLMAVNPAIDCEHCGKMIRDWELDENGQLFCPFCEKEIRLFRRHVCSCGGRDMVTLSVAANNNFGSDLDGSVTPYNEKLNRLILECEKKIEQEVRQHLTGYPTSSEIHIGWTRRLM